jgi:hypothetical protein
MKESGAQKELLAIRNAATSLRVGGRQPYRLRKEWKSLCLLPPWYAVWEEPSQSGSVGKALAQASLRVKQVPS